MEFTKKDWIYGIIGALYVYVMIWAFQIIAWAM